MLTGVVIKNFKKLQDVNIELGKTVIFIGPNNSGKSAALQALALWDIGLRRWNEKREGKALNEKSRGVAINRKDLIAIPIPHSNLLWNNLRTRHIERQKGQTQQTQNIRIEIIVDGISKGSSWSCGFEFDYANEESFYCRPIRLSIDKKPARMPVPPEAADVKVAFLPPMSGLAATELKLEPGGINVLLGQGQTAQVLRNMCYQLFEKRADNSDWKDINQHMDSLFRARLLEPKFIKERGEITMAYQESKGAKFDLSSSGRGFQQTLLLLAHMYANPGTVLLLDEPDAHLEVLRQRQIYQLLTDVAEKKGCQVIAASHSEVVLTEAAARDILIAFVGQPHRIDDRGSQVLKALKEIGFDQYYLAEETGWVLYLEGPTDLAILKSFAATLKHPAAKYMDSPFVVYVGNQLTRVKEHFYGLLESKADLQAVALFDRDAILQNDPNITILQWKKREIENYLCFEEVLLEYARKDWPGDTFALNQSDYREKLMKESIEEISQALETLGEPSPWSPDIKASNVFLDKLFDKYFKKLGMANIMHKTDYHVLAELVRVKRIDAEIIEKLDIIYKVAQSAKPRG